VQVILIRTLISSILRIEEAHETIPFLLPHTKILLLGLCFCTVDQVIKHELNLSWQMPSSLRCESSPYIGPEGRRQLIQKLEDQDALRR
jgi:hypothetical protein